MPPQLKLFCCGEVIQDKRGNTYSLVSGSKALTCEMCDEKRHIGYLTRTRIRFEFICNHCVDIHFGRYNPHYLVQRNKFVWTGERWSLLFYEGRVYNSKIDAMTDHRISFGNGKHVKVVSKQKLEELERKQNE